MLFATTETVKCMLVRHIKLSHLKDGVENVIAMKLPESQSYCQTYVLDTILWFSTTKIV